MVAAKDKTVSSAGANGLHAPAVSLDARGFGIMESTAVHGAPEIGVELEIAAPPLLAHGVEDFPQVLLHFRVRPIERVPRSMPPPAKRYQAGHKRFIVSAAYEPVRMLLKDL